MGFFKFSEGIERVHWHETGWTGHETNCSYGNKQSTSPNLKVNKMFVTTPLAYVKFDSKYSGISGQLNDNDSQR